MTIVAPGAADLGSVRRAQGIHGVSAGGVLLPAGTKRGGAGAYIKSKVINQPISRNYQLFPTKSFTSPLTGVTHTMWKHGPGPYEAFIKGCHSFIYWYQAVTAKLLEEDTYVVIPLFCNSFTMKKLAFIGRPPETEEEAEKESWGDFVEEWASGFPPELVVAWAPHAPERYADHMRSVSYEGETNPLALNYYELAEWNEEVANGIEPLNQGIDPFLAQGEGKHIVGLGWAGGGPDDPGYVGRGNFHPTNPGEPYYLIFKGSVKLQEYRAAFAALSKTAQEKALVELGKARAEAIAALEATEAAKNKKIEEERGYAIHFPRDAFPYMELAKQFVEEYGTDGRGNLNYGNACYRFRLRFPPGLGDLLGRFEASGAKGGLMLGYQLPEGSFFGGNLFAENEIASAYRSTPGESQLETFTAAAPSLVGGAVKLGSQTIGHAPS